MKALPAMLLLGAALSACTTVGNGRVQTLQAAEADSDPEVRKAVRIALAQLRGAA